MKGDDPAIMMQVVYEVCGYMDPALVPTMLGHIFVPHDPVVQRLMFNVVADHGLEILQVPIRTWKIQQRRWREVWQVAGSYTNSMSNRRPISLQVPA